MKIHTALWEIRAPQLPKPGKVCMDHGIALLSTHPEARRTVLNLKQRKDTCDICSYLYKQRVGR